MCNVQMRELMRRTTIERASFRDAPLLSLAEAPEGGTSALKISDATNSENLGAKPNLQHYYIK